MCIKKSLTKKKQTNIKATGNKDFTFWKQDANITLVEIVMALLSIVNIVCMLYYVVVRSG